MSCRHFSVALLEAGMRYIVNLKRFVGGSVLVDFHAHVLPGVDHGSPDLTHSLRQLSMAEACGVKELVATPHFYSGQESLEAFLERRQSAFQALCAANHTGVTLHLGAEVHVSSSLLNLPGLDRLAVDGKHTLLLELPHGAWGSRMIDILRNIQAKHFNVVIAHVDRYDTNIAMDLEEEEIGMQINAEALCSLHDRHFWKQMIQRGAVAWLGSDVHHQIESAYTHFSKASKLVERWSPGFMERDFKVLTTNNARC